MAVPSFSLSIVVRVLELSCLGVIFPLFFLFTLPNMAPPTLAAALHLLLFTSLTTAQQISTLTPEVHPTLLTQTCTLAAGCPTHATLLVAHALAHPLHSTLNPSVSCLPLNATLCPDAATCSTACALSGISYASLGVLTSSTA